MDSFITSFVFLEVGEGRLNLLQSLGFELFCQICKKVGKMASFLVERCIMTSMGRAKCPTRYFRQLGNRYEKNSYIRNKDHG